MALIPRGSFPSLVPGCSISKPGISDFVSLIEVIGLPASNEVDSLDFCVTFLGFVVFSGVVSSLSERKRS